MNPQEQSLYNIICNNSFETPNGELRLYQHEYRIGNDENTQSGTWSISIASDGRYYVLTHPNVGRFLVAFYLQEA